MEDTLGAPMGQGLGACWHPRAPGGEGDGLGGHRPGCPLPLTFLSSLTCIFRSFLFPSPPPFTFFLPSFPVFPPFLPTLLCQFNLPLVCLAFPGSRCQASTFRTLPPEELV